MKNILKITFVIIGTLIGAGFASGQEMYIFFYSYGVRGIIGLVISSILIGMVVCKTLKIIDKYGVSNYKEFIDLIINKKYEKKYFNIKNIFNIIINIFILITFFVMIAGFGAYFEQSFGINHFLGSIVLALLCFIVFKSSVKGLVRVNEILIPILIILISIIGILNFSQMNFENTLSKMTNLNSPGWLLSAFLYSSYNSILLIPTLITLKNYLKNKKSIYIISFITTLVVILLAIILFFILGNINADLKNIEMPVVYAVEKMFKGLTYIYGFVIVSSIFTTSISLGTSFLQNITKNEKSYTHLAGIMCITSVAVSNFGFSNLVNLLYPVFGYLGLIQIFIMFSKQNVEKNKKN